MHGRTHRFDTERDERIEVVIEGIAKRRHEDHGAGWSGLVMVVHDLRKPLEEHLTVHVRGLRHVRHVEIAVVVVADVVLKQERQPAQAALRRVLLAHVPIRYQLLAIRIRQHAENDVVVQQPHGLRIGAAHHLVDLLHFLLRTHGFARVEPAIDPHHGFAFARELMRLIVRQIFGARQPSGNILIVVEPLDRFRRTDNRHVLAPVFRGRADIDQLHAIGFGCQLVPIGVELRIGRHLVVVAKIEPERFFRRCYSCRVLGLDQRNGCEQKQSETRQKRPSVREFGEPALQLPRPRLHPGTTDGSAGVRGLRGR